MLAGMTIPNVQVAIVLKWPRQVTVVAGIAAIIGACGFLSWLWPIFSGQSLTPAGSFQVIASLLLLPAGLGITVMSLQTVKVTQNCIENRHLGFCRRLDLPTCRIDRVQSNGFRLVDGNGKRLMINHWLRGAEELFALVADREDQDATTG
jgi:hypothetical protein